MGAYRGRERSAYMDYWEGRRNDLLGLNVLIEERKIPLFGREGRVKGGKPLQRKKREKNPMRGTMRGKRKNPVFTSTSLQKKKRRGENPRLVPEEGKKRSHVRGEVEEIKPGHGEKEAALLIFEGKQKEEGSINHAIFQKSKMDENFHEREKGESPELRGKKKRRS